jgi:beta-glucosidase
MRRGTLLFYFAFLVIPFFIPHELLSQTLEQKIDEILSQMTLEEKVLQLHPEGGFNTATNTRLNIPGFVMADGPHGVRDGMATSFPVGISMAATWDPDLIYRVGVAMGKEFLGKGKHQALGPCMDLDRDPRNGRSPETGGEDAYLCAKITTALTLGIQSTGCIAAAKHYNANNIEIGRTENNVIITQRQLMDDNGYQFRSAVQDGGVFSIMNAYNLINNQKCAENYNLLTTILRDHWGFPYYVVSDWGSIWDAKRAIEAGCDIEMGSDLYEQNLLNLVNSGSVSLDVINGAVRKVLRTKILAGMLDNFPPGNPDDVNSTEHQQLSLEAGKKSIVLLKNLNNLLPLDKNAINKIALIGPSANITQLDGAGSAYVTPFYTVTPKAAIENKIGVEKVLYSKGCDINSNNTSGYTDALTKAAEADVVIFIGGLDQSQEGEGFDRAGGSINLPGRQQELINSLASVNQNLIVVLESGGICGINACIENINSLIYVFYPGQEGGNAIADVIFGDYNPGGKLPVTYPTGDSQLPPWNSNFTDDFGAGYRWFDHQNLVPQFAFGFGLSYTTFSYSNLVISPLIAPAGEIITVSVDVTNTGSRSGDEVVQLYVSDPEVSVTMPLKQLKGFKRVTLEPSEIKTVSFKISSEELYFFDETTNTYKVEPGVFNVLLGGSSDNLPMQGSFEILSAPLKPDLKISSIRSFPRYPTQGSDVVFLATIKNQGTGPSPAGTVHKVTFRINGIEVSRSIEFTNSIPAGGMALVCANEGPSGSNVWLSGEVGTYEVEAVVDDNTQIDECVEDNNSYTTSIQVIPVPPTNIALNKSVTVSSVEAAGLEGHYAVDGSRGTRWSSSFSDPQWLTIDLGSVQHFNEILIYWETAYAREYRLEISDNASDWITIAHITNSDGGIDKITTSADTRYLRMYGIRRATEWGYSIYELEIYNVSSTEADDLDSSVPLKYFLSNNYPNPFNPTTKIRYSIPQNPPSSPLYQRGETKRLVTLKVYDVLGNEVATLVNEEKPTGSYEVTFDAFALASGIYFYQLKAGSYFEVKKMILMK